MKLDKIKVQVNSLTKFQLHQIKGGTTNTLAAPSIIIIEDIDSM